MHQRSYQIAEKSDSRKRAQLLAQDGQGLLPMEELLCQAKMAVDELIDVAGRATIEAVLTLSAPQTAGPKHPGPRADAQRPLRAAIDEVFGDKNPILRCRNHRLRNVLDCLLKKGLETRQFADDPALLALFDAV